MAEQIILTEKDQKIKKRWLIATLFYVMFSLLSGYFMLGRIIPLEEVSKGEMLQSLLMLEFFPILLYVLLYYFSYVKNGYRFLIASLIEPIASLIQNATTIKDFFEIKNSIDILIVVISMVVVNGWWYYASIKLIFLNKRLKASISFQKTKETID